MAERKEVLVKFRGLSRVVSFDKDEELVQSIKSSFTDVLELALPRSKLVIQIKDENWFGEFVDIQPDQVIANRSVLNVIVHKLTTESQQVKTLHYLSNNYDNWLYLI